MSRKLDDAPPLQALVEVARDFHARGWMAGTAGNLSVRDREDTGSCWITASGHPKGRLEVHDFVRVNIHSGEVIERLTEVDRPSAESSIHACLYRLFPQARACLHVHSVTASLATERHAAQGSLLPLPALEMLKGLGVWEQNPRVFLPLFENILDVPRIAARVERRFQSDPPRITALMIRGHGVTVWGDSLQQAYDRLEIVEFILAYMAGLPDA